MAKIIEIPKMGNTVEEVIISEIFVKEGDEIKKGDKIFSYETDKTTTDENSTESGTILKVLIKENDESPVFSPAFIIGKKGEDISKVLKEVKVKKPKKVEVKKESPKPVVKATPKKVTQPTSKPMGNSTGISPRALNALRRSGVPLNSIAYGSGPRGRMISSDVNNAKKLSTMAITGSGKPNPIAVKVADIISGSESQSGDEEFKYAPMRAAIAKGMKDSQANSAATTLSISVDAKELLNARAAIKKEIANGGANISINDLIIFALSRVLPKYSKTINAHVFDDKSIAHGDANIAIAVDTKIGLMVPVVKQTNHKTLEQISQEAKEAIISVREGNLKGIDLKSGTFTISNVGAMNIEVFTPVLNAGQAGILGVGAVTLKPRKSKDGMVEFYNSMILSLTIDHRLADGADGARFLNDLKLVIENINLIMN